MVDDDEKVEDSVKIEESEPTAEKQAADQERAKDSAATPVAPPKKEEQRPKPLEMSPDLMKALEEAEASVNRRAPARPKPRAGKEEVELEVEVEGPGEEEEFDPNKVDNYQPRAPMPPPSTPAEMELKMQILDLRQKVRAAEAEVQNKIKEMKSNAEQARMFKQQLDAQKAKVQREKSDWFNYGHEPLLKEILLVADNLERALSHAGPDADVKVLRDGFELIQKQLLSTLTKFGVAPVDALGKPFNPEFHQAMLQKEDGGKASGTVLEEHQKGYMLKDRLLRPAMVTVSKRPSAQPEDAPAGPENGGDQQGQDG